MAIREHHSVMPCYRTHHSVMPCYRTRHSVMPGYRTCHSVIPGYRDTRIHHTVIYEQRHTTPLYEAIGTYHIGIPGY